jgi:thioredoxin reductase
MDESYDVVVVGGGAGGLSGAVALARSRRSVLVVDAGDPRNAPADHVHNFLTRDGTPPAELYTAGRTEVTRYGGRVETGLVTALSRDGEVFRVEIGPRTVTARRLLVATGLRDELPDVPGLAARWGIDVLHCPYCHGWEVRDKRIGVLATGPTAVHQALLFRQLSLHVTLLSHSGPALDGEQRDQLEARGITVTEGTVTEIEADPAGLTGVRLAGGRHVELDAVVAAPRMHARAELLAPLGLKPAEVLIGDYLVGTHIEADPTGATAVPGVWVAGNLATLQAQVITSAAAGLAAGAAINLDLVLAEARRQSLGNEHDLAVGVAGRQRPVCGGGLGQWIGRRDDDPQLPVRSEPGQLEPGGGPDLGARVGSWRAGDHLDARVEGPSALPSRSSRHDPVP